MIYILHDDRVTNELPEIEYATGVMIPRKNGWFIVDTADSDIHTFGSTVVFGGSDYPIDEQLQFANKLQGEIVFLQLKLAEMKKTTIDYFFPSTFKKYAARLNELVVEYPEFVI